MNLVVLKGNLGKAPEVKSTNEIIACRFSLATKGYKDKTDWHNITAFGKTAEVCIKYLQKGSQALVQGRISYNKWTDKEGKERFSTDIIADRIELIDKKKSDDQHGIPINEDFDPNDIPF
jgi:single-strand DNA-binding protein